MRKSILVSHSNIFATKAPNVRIAGGILEFSLERFDSFDSLTIAHPQYSYCRSATTRATPSLTGGDFPGASAGACTAARRLYYGVGEPWSIQAAATASGTEKPGVFVLPPILVINSQAGLFQERVATTPELDGAAPGWSVAAHVVRDSALHREAKVKTKRKRHGSLAGKQF